MRQRRRGNNVVESHTEGGISRLAIASLLALATGCAAPTGQPASSTGAAVAIQEQGSFAVGGTVVTAPGTFDPISQGAYNPAGADPRGQTLHGDHTYVFYQVPANARRVPLVFWHGHGQSGKTWETTPDGREGFQTVFLRRRYPVYLLDQPRRGRAARSTQPATIPATPDDQTWFGIFRLGVWPDLYPGVQFSREAGALDQFFRQMVPNAGPYDAEVNTNAVSALFDKIGQGVLVYQGESGGEPRLMEVPGQRVDDISCAIDYLVRQPWVDPDLVGSLGICAGGSYAICNAQTELRVKAVATVSLFNLGEARRVAMGLRSFEERMTLLKDAAEQRTREARGEAVRLIAPVPESPAEFTDKTPDLYRQGYEYYLTPRAQHPNAPNRYMLSTLPLQMNFFPFAQVETISPRPILMIVGENADTKFWSDGVLEKAKTPKDLFVIKGATHMDMYDKSQYVTPAVVKLTAFFSQYLSPAGGSR